MKRALVDRSNSIENLPLDYFKTTPNIIQSSLIFRDSKLAKNPNSLNNFDTVNESDNLLSCPNCKYILNLNYSVLRKLL